MPGKGIERIRDRGRGPGDRGLGAPGVELAGQAVRRLIRAAGAKLFFLPRYPPDLNPTEQVFAKLKTLLRKADPRTTQDTWRRIGSLLDHFTAQECANYLANAGYASKRRLRFNLKRSCSSSR
jgi:transposase